MVDVHIAALRQLADVTVPALHKPQDDITAMARLALRLLTDLSAMQVVQPYVLANLSAT